MGEGLSDLELDCFLDAILKIQSIGEIMDKQLYYS